MILSQETRKTLNRQPNFTHKATGEEEEEETNKQKKNKLVEGKKSCAYPLEGKL